MAIVIQVDSEPAYDREVFEEAMAAIGAEPLTQRSDNRSWIVSDGRSYSVGQIREFVLTHATREPSVAVFDAPIAAGGSPQPLHAPTPRRADPSRPSQSLPASLSKVVNKDQTA